MINDSFESYVQSGDALFHYTKLSSAIEFILPTQKLKLSSLENTNDPEEYKFMIYNEMAWGNVLSSIDEKIRTAQNELDRVRRFDSRIICFCINKRTNYDGIYGFSKSRMWSQYGESHKGVCLVFSKKLLNKAISKQLNAPQDFFKQAVTYRKEQRIDVEVKTIDGNKLDKMSATEYAYYHIRKYYKELFFSKNIDYRDESEYRYLLLSSDAPYDYISLGNSLKGIIVGDKCPKVYFSMIEDFAESFNCDCRQLYWLDWKPYLLLLKEKT